jgi:glutathione S-transferase
MASLTNGTARSDPPDRPGMTRPVQIIGSYLSPYVRKVLVVLDLKGIPYEIDPIVPFLGDERFSAISPVRRVPVLIDDRVTLSDSTVICEYLEERHPEPALHPRDVVARARGRWLEEFADTRMGEVFIWRLFNQVAIRPFVWGEQTDTDVVERTLREDVPQVLDYLETQLPADGFLFGSVSVADVAVATFFRNAAFARFKIDAARWPLTASFVERVLRIDSFAKLLPFEKTLLRTSVAQHRGALAEIGAPLTSDTYSTTNPRRGVMRI